jgi:hypothetical protein
VGAPASRAQYHPHQPPVGHFFLAKLPAPATALVVPLIPGFARRPRGTEFDSDQRREPKTHTRPLENTTPQSESDWWSSERASSPIAFGLLGHFEMKIYITD